MYRPGSFNDRTRRASRLAMTIVHLIRSSSNTSHDPLASLIVISIRQRAFAKVGAAWMRCGRPGTLLRRRQPRQTIVPVEGRHPKSCAGLTRVTLMNAKVVAFLGSLKTANPPAAAVPLLRAVWHGLRGEWETAHQIAQDDTTAEGAWVPWLHRIEGDLANARYWYRQAQRRWRKVICARKGRPLPHFFSGPSRR